MPARILLLALFALGLLTGCEQFVTDEAYNDCPSGEYCAADAAEGGNLSAYTVRKKGRQKICNRWSTPGDVCPAGYSGPWPKLYDCSRQGPYQVTCTWYTKFSAGSNCQVSIVYMSAEGIRYVSSQGTRLKMTVTRSGPPDWDCIEPSLVAALDELSSDPPVTP